MDELLYIVQKRYKLKKSSRSKLYTNTGVELFDEDLIMLKHQDMLYFALKGEDYDNIHIMDLYERLDVLGEGGFGTVYKGKNKETREEVAIKYINVEELLSNASTIEEIFRESKTLKMLNNKHIIKLHHAFLLDKNFVMIMEYASGGELFYYMEEKGKLEEVEVRRIISQIIFGINACH